MFLTQTELDHFEEKFAKNYKDFFVKKFISGYGTIIDLAKKYQIRIHDNKFFYFKHWLSSQVSCKICLPPPAPSVADLGCLSRILIFTHPGSRIQDLGSRIQKQQQREG
jgi:hypothetical protein